MAGRWQCQSVGVGALLLEEGGGDATINIRWEVGWGHVTNGGGKVVFVRGGAIATVPPSIVPSLTIVIAPFLSIAIAQPSVAPPLLSIAIATSTNH